MKFSSTVVDEVDPLQPLTEASRANETGDNPARTNYLFVSNVRFLAMIAIVGVHTLPVWGSAPPPASYLQVILVQMMKFGTIGFFLISGYLVGEGLTRGNPTSYFYRRLRSILLPWCVWSLVWFVIAYWGWRAAGDPNLQGAALHELVRQYLTFVSVRSIYWFVPNFFVCLALVLWMYKRVPDHVQGPLFLAFSLFYGLNIYLKLVPVRHTSALLGYVFYQWLGLLTYKHRHTWSAWLERISWVHLAIFAAAAASTSLCEMHLLRKLEFDEFNTLRISNQIFSLAMTLLIAKSRRTLFPRWLNVRSETFGIYLIHPILVQTFQTVFPRIPIAVRSEVGSNGTILILLSLITFVATYLLSLMLTKLIRRIPALAWAVGQR